MRKKGPLGKTAFIDVLEVHRDYRHRGVGKALVSKAFEIAKENHCNTISVWPDKRAIGFYRECGIDNIVFNIIDMEIDLRKVKGKEDTYKVNDFPNDYTIIKDMELITPRIELSFNTMA